MKLTEQEQAALSVSVDTVCYLVALHDVNSREINLSPELRAYHAERAAHWRKWRDLLRAEQFNRESV